LEQAYRSTLDDPIDRASRLGAWVVITGIWYEVGSR
jgi:hypothetical protein